MTPSFSLTSPIATPTYDVCVVDGSYLIHRILYASSSKGDPPFSEMMTSMGEPTGAIYGCLKTLRASINLPEFVTKDIVIVWDGRPSMLSQRRVSIYPKYKTHEPSTDPKEASDSARHRSLLEEQRPKLNYVLNLLGVPCINIPYREGDDIIGCAVRTLPGKVLIMSDDRDYYQLVSDRVHVYRAGIKEPTLIHLDNFEQKVGVKSPSQYLLSAAISGDGSDSIDGIPGVGGTTAERVANNAAINDGWVSYAAIKASAEGLMISDTRNRNRYAKLLANLGVVTRNLELMDLRLEHWTPVEQGMFMSEFRRAREVQEREVVKVFNSLEFKSYLSEFSDWIQPFRRLTRHGSI